MQDKRISLTDESIKAIIANVASNSPAKSEKEKLQAGIEAILNNMRMSIRVDPETKERLSVMIAHGFFETEADAVEQAVKMLYLSQKEKLIEKISSLG